MENLAEVIAQYEGYQIVLQIERCDGGPISRVRTCRGALWWKNDASQLKRVPEHAVRKNWRITADTRDLSSTYHGVHNTIPNVSRPAQEQQQVSFLSTYAAHSRGAAAPCY